ncbi:TPA: hypothetical protein ACXZJH_003507 [Salmonella enterica]
MLTLTICKHEKDTQHLFTSKRAPAGAVFLSIRNRGFESGPVFLPCKFSEALIMKFVMHIIYFIPAMIVFAFQRADVANRIDYVGEDSVF